MHIGDNQSKSKGIISAIKNSQKNGGNATQIFLRSPMRKQTIKLSQDDQQNCKQFLEKNNLKLIIHSSYLYNFCKTNLEWAITELTEEINVATQIGAIGCIIHMGKTTTIPYDEAIQNFIDNINTILNAIPNNGAKLILENSAHQGTEIGYTIPQLSHIHNNIHPDNLSKIGYCIDSCHAFAAGYNFDDGAQKLIDEFSEMIGMEFLNCIHLNDSKKECGCKVDRHANIDQGCIGKTNLQKFISNLQTANYDGIIILETPDDSTSNRQREINILKN